ncbi:ABC transporter substrate-binding protein [Brevibacillus fluminis]|uniref:ABC transporter substrate-binding protein n=1 Tax=Brevibacillus fluminis TaxID=511487 RepID=A0A3M8DP79_9BACL|nr:ABC transporter substrate-binding protein [Brevibacillus fluminis]RNB89908.1 ABC transporter substrate-binding protein [Brevibacillus fluminis]
MKKKRLTKALLTIGVSLSVLAAGCSGSPSTQSGGESAKGSESNAGGEAKAQAGGTVTFALEHEVVSLDPAFSYDFSTGPVVNQITEPLMRFEKGKSVVPNLAEKVDNPDPKTYVYTIRQGVTFSDGTPMTVDDVIFSLERTRDPKTASYVGWMFSNVDKIEKAGDWTVKVTLKEPDANWQYAMATSAGHVISKAYYEAHKANFGKPDGGTMGTGPFKYVSWQTGSELVLEKNPNYWNKEGGPYLDKIVYKVIPEGMTRITGLKTGQINMALNLPLDLQEVVAKMDNVKISRSDSFLSDFIAFNTQRKPFNDVKVRQAISHALDRQKIVTELIKDAGIAGKTVPIPPALWTFEKDKWEKAYSEIPDYAFDTDKAKQLLSESSVPTGFNGKILTDSDSFRMNTALALQAAVKPLGINLEIEKVTGEELNTRAWGGARDYDIVVQNWSSDFPDPAGNMVPLFLSANTADGGSNFANYKNPEVDKLLDEQNRLTDPAKRTELMIQAEKLIANDAPWIVVSHQKNFLAMSKNVEGYDIDPLYFWEGFMKDVKLTQ